MATDARVRYTKSVIRECFLELHSQKPVEKITVMELCEKADINRATFYKYYRDIYDLKNQYELEMAEALISSVHIMDLNHAHEILLQITTAMYQARDRYLSLRGTNDLHLIKHVIDRTFEDKKSYFMQATHQHDSQECMWTYYFMCAGVASVLLEWVSRGMQETPEKVAVCLTNLIAHTTAMSSGK